MTELGGFAQVVIRPFGSYFRGGGAHLTHAERLGVFSAGLEGSAILADRVADRVHAGGTATPCEMTLMWLDALGAEWYILDTLSNSRLETAESLFTGGARGVPGDPAEYVSDLAALRLSHSSPSRTDAIFFSEVQSTARRVRRGSLINFLDFELVSASVGLGRDFVWNGERPLHVRWLTLGPLSISPKLRHTLSPNGPERQARSRYKVGAHTGEAYVRWSDAITSEGTRLVGGGGEYQHSAVRGFVPKVAIDVWRNPNGLASVRPELSTTFRRSPDDRWVLSMGIGAKGQGYVAGYPLARGAYFNIGAGIQF